MKKAYFALTALIIAVALSAACGGGSSDSSGMTKIADKKINDGLTVSIYGDGGKLKNGAQDIEMRFEDASGKPVEMKAASLNFHMPAMGTMPVMNDPAELSTTSTPGKFGGKVNLQMAGEWIAQIAYEGEEKGKTTIKMTAY